MVKIKKWRSSAAWIKVKTMQAKVWSIFVRVIAKNLAGHIDLLAPRIALGEQKLCASGAN